MGELEKSKDLINKFELVFSILSYLTEHKFIQVKDLMALRNMSQRTAQRNLNILYQYGYLKKLDWDKSGLMYFPTNRSNNIINNMKKRIAS